MKTKKIGLFAGLLTGALVFGCLDSVPAMAKEKNEAVLSEGKDEIVYAKLTEAGTVHDIYVVNQFDVISKGEITDYGDYSKVENLSGTETIEQAQDEIKMTAKPEVFRYQGTLSKKALPWQFEIKYLLNGEPLQEERLAGADGLLNIRIKSKQNQEISKTFYDNYMLQITLTMDGDKCSDIKAEDAAVANAGSDKTVVYTVMPGKDADYVLEANVKDFSMAGIQIAAMPFSMAIELPDTSDMTDGLSTLTEAINGIDYGIGSLSQGISGLNGGISKLADGAKTYGSGIAALSKNSNQIIDSSELIKNALSQMSKRLNSSLENNSGEGMGELAQLPRGLAGMAQGLNALADGLDGVKVGYGDFFSGMDGLISALPDGAAISESDIGELQAALASDPINQDRVKVLARGYMAATQIKASYRGVRAQADQLSAGLDTMIQGDGSETNPGLRGISVQLNNIAGGVEGAVENNDLLAQVQELSNGLGKISEEYKAFHEGLASYTEGVNQLSSNYAQLEGGVKELREGSDIMAQGSKELHKGSTQLAGETSKLPDKVQEEIRKLTDEYNFDDFQMVSFVSPNNKDVKSVQFVMTTDSVKEAEKVKEEPKKKEKSTLIDKFTELFK